MKRIKAKCKKLETLIRQSNYSREQRNNERYFHFFIDALTVRVSNKPAQKHSKVQEK